MKNPALLSSLAQVFLLAGCAASLPTEAGGKLALSADRQPVASADAMRATCRKLTDAISVHVERMKALQIKAKSEQEAPPANLWSAWQRSFGATGAGVAALEGLDRERRGADEANAALRAKGCQTVDIDAALIATPPPGPKTL
jgi:hypothetical protein